MIYRTLLSRSMYSVQGIQKKGERARTRERERERERTERLVCHEKGLLYSWFGSWMFAEPKGKLDKS